MKFLTLATLCTIACAAIATAQVPSLINYQGRLTDADGAPVTGSKNFVISIYDAATGGTLLYTEDIGAVTLDDNGVYSFQFGGTGTSNTLATESIGTTDGSNLTYTKALSNTPVVANSITVTDGTNSWSQAVGNPGETATATANTVSGFVIGATITNGGVGYTTVPAVTITGSGTGATATAAISNGQVTGITITNAGSGYTGDTTITLAPPLIPFRVDYSAGAITATYSSASSAGREIRATYRYATNSITGALSSGEEHWLAMSVNGTVQATRQRILAVPYAIHATAAEQAVTAQHAANATTANSATTVVDGAITAAKLSPGAVTESIGSEGNMIASKTLRSDLVSQGYKLFSTLGYQFDTDSITAAPDARSSYSAVWTGTEMIIWGGSVSGTRVKSGYRYNPVTNTWTAMTSTNAPSARLSHTAIWTGTEMIVWGGNDGTWSSGFTNSGARYNPTTNTWTAITLTNAPGARAGHTAVWTGTKMIIFGYSGQPTDYQYDPATNTWTAISSTNDPAGREGHTAIWTGTEMIVWGGNNGTATSEVNSGARYNPTTNTWTAMTLTNAPTSRIGHKAVWTGTEMIIWGGSPSGASNTGARYNPSTDTWTATTSTNAPTGRIGHTAVWTGTEMIIWGASGSGVLNSGARYNPIANTWITLNSTGAPSGRSGHTAIWTGTAMIVWGGNDGIKDLNSGASYVPGDIFFYSKF
jgi:N-acetylneuraminic acid mutarotase